MINDADLLLLWASGCGKQKLIRLSDSCPGLRMLVMRPGLARTPVLYEERLMSETSILLLDAAGRRRSPATLPGYLAGRAPRIQRQLGHTDLGTTSTYLQGIDPSEIIDAVRTRRAPTIPATAGLTV